MLCIGNFLTTYQGVIKSVHSLYPICLYLLRDMLTHNADNAGVWFGEAVITADTV